MGFDSAARAVLSVTALAWSIPLPPGEQRKRETPLAAPGEADLKDKLPVRDWPRFICHRGRA